MVMGDNKISDYEKFRQIDGNFYRHVHLWLHAKPLDGAIGQVPTPYCPVGRHGRRF